MVVDPSTDNPDNGVQGLPPVCAEVLPEKVPQPFQFDRKAIFPAGKFQPPVSLSRRSPVTSKAQEVKRPQTFSPLVRPHRHHVTHSDKLRFVFMKLEAKPPQPLRQYAVESLSSCRCSKVNTISSAYLTMSARPRICEWLISANHSSIAWCK